RGPFFTSRTALVVLPGVRLLGTVVVPIALRLARPALAPVLVCAFLLVALAWRLATLEASLTPKKNRFRCFLGRNVSRRFFRLSFACAFRRRRLRCNRFDRLN